MALRILLAEDNAINQDVALRLRTRRGAGGPEPHHLLHSRHSADAFRSLEVTDLWITHYHPRGGEVILLGPKWRQYGGCHGRTQISMPAKVHRSAHRDLHRPVCFGAATRSKTVSLVPLLWHRSQHIGQQDVFRRTNDAAPKHTGGGELERSFLRQRGEGRSGRRLKSPSRRNRTAPRSTGALYDWACPNSSGT